MFKLSMKSNIVSKLQNKQVNSSERENEVYTETIYIQCIQCIRCMYSVHCTLIRL